MNEVCSLIRNQQEIAGEKKLFPVRHSNVTKRLLSGVNTNNG